MNRTLKTNLLKKRKGAKKAKNEIQGDNKNKQGRYGQETQGLKIGAYKIQDKNLKNRKFKYKTDKKNHSKNPNIQFL